MQYFSNGRPYFTYPLEHRNLFLAQEFLVRKSGLIFDVSEESHASISQIYLHISILLFFIDHFAFPTTTVTVYNNTFLLVHSYSMCADCMALL